MLSTADAELVRREVHLPGLALLLDGDALAEALQPFVPTKQISAVAPYYVRYKPGTNCLIGYRFTFGGEEGLGYAKAYRRGNEEKLQKALQGRGTSAGPTHVLLVQEAVVFFFFPADRKLRALTRLGGEAERIHLLRKIFPDLTDPASATLQTLRYKPERRYVARLDQEEPAAVLKWYTEAGYRAARAGARASAQAAALRTPQLIGKSSRLRLLAFEWLPGQPLREIVLQDNFPEREAVAAVAAAGASLAMLHQQPSRELPPRSRTERAGALFAAADGIVAPNLAAPARSFARRLAVLLDEPSGPLGPVHGDFYADQVLVDGEAAAFIDFDHSALGDPAADLGNFLAHLERSRMQGHLTPSRTARLREGLLEGYCLQGGSVSASHLARHTAAGLLQLAPHPFRVREPDWAAQTEALLMRAEAVLAEAEKRYAPCGRRAAEPEHQVPIVVVEDPYCAASDPSMPFLRQALDPEQTTSRLARPLSERCGAPVEVRLQAIRVLRHKPGRRCLVAYDLKMQQKNGRAASLTLLGKVRAKGLDRAAYELQQSLWRSGFGSDSPDGVSVPEPFGVLPEWHMWLQRKVPGTAVTERLAGPGGPALAARVAREVYKLHEAGIAPRRSHSMADELAILDERLTRAAEEMPGLAQRIAGVLEGCYRLAENTPEPEPRPIHRDFYADNILVDGDRLYLIDLDLYCEGDPAVDAGNFIAHVTEQSVRCLGDVEALQPCEAAFESAFVACHGEAVRPAVHAYTMLTLARHISISTQIPERREHTERLVALCEHRLGQVVSCPSP